jgi:hypothetical protein
MAWRRRRLLLAGVLAASACVLVGTGCAKARAEMVADGPPLEVPAPPPRVIAPIDDTLAATPQPLEALIVPPNTPPANPTRRQPSRPPADNERETAATPPPVAAAPAAPAPEAPRDLRPAGSVADAEAQKKARSLIGQAQQLLTRVDSRSLSSENKAQLEEARRFVERAEQEIKDRNFVFAETFADKAVTLATQLIGR